MSGEPGLSIYNNSCKDIKTHNTPKADEEDDDDDV
jgi:hypothetical protein